MRRAEAATDTGVKRQTNEDRVFTDARAGLFLVSDGMGGAEGGEIAAATSCEAIAEFVDTTRQGLIARLPYASDPRFPPEANRVAMGVRVANARVHQMQLANPLLRGMGATIVALLLGDVEACIAHVGDSRAYRWREERLELLTRDHTKLYKLVDRGMPFDEAARRRDSRALTRALGIDPDVLPTVRLERLRDRDLFLLCSDGLTDRVSQRRLSEMLSGLDAEAVAGRPRDLSGLARALVAAANGAGGDDNISVVLVEHRS